MLSLCKHFFQNWLCAGRAWFAGWMLVCASPWVWSYPLDTPDPLGTLLLHKGLIVGEPNGPAPVPVPVPAPFQPTETVLTALGFLGVPYLWGGTSTLTGFDCSGFTRHIFLKSSGLLLPRRSDEQAQAPGLMSVAKDRLQPGDLVFFNTQARTFSHVGIYVGREMFIHAPRSGAVVRMDDMRDAYWQNRFTGGRRVVNAMAPRETILSAEAHTLLPAFTLDPDEQTLRH